MLLDVGLRPTRQRLDLASLLFMASDRHVTAEQLHYEARQAGVSVSVATVYNTLHQFTEAGLLRQLAVDGSRTFFDTNTGDHHHFFCEREGVLMDIADNCMHVSGIPEAPEGMQIARVDVIVRLAKQARR